MGKHKSREAGMAAPKPSNVVPIGKRALAVPAHYADRTAVARYFIAKYRRDMGQKGASKGERRRAKSGLKVWMRDLKKLRPEPAIVLRFSDHPLIKDLCRC